METLMTQHHERLAYINSVSPSWAGYGKCRECKESVKKTELRDHLGVYCKHCFDAVIVPSI